MGDTRTDFKRIFTEVPLVYSDGQENKILLWCGSTLHERVVILLHAMLVRRHRRLTAEYCETKRSSRRIYTFKRLQRLKTEYAKFDATLTRLVYSCGFYSFTTTNLDY